MTGPDTRLASWRSTLATDDEMDSERTLDRRASTREVKEASSACEGDGKVEDKR